MTTTTALVASLVIAALLVAAFAKPTRKAISGLISTDKKGRTTLVIWPAGNKRRRKKRR